MPSKFYTEHKAQIKHFIHQAIIEDIGAGDITTNSLFTNSKNTTAKLWVKSPCVIAGIELAEFICAQYTSKLQWNPKVNDGDKVEEGIVAGTLYGPIVDLLAIERLLLNCIQRMSGIASYVADCMHLIKAFPTTLLDTRKTTPNFRYPEKWAVLIGGAQNHRMGLFDMILIKDNHIDAFGSLEAVLEQIENYRKTTSRLIPVVVEIRNENALQTALKFPWIKRLLLDNMSPLQLSKALKIIDGKIAAEASGNITPANLLDYAKTGVEFISMGALTYGAVPVDMSFKIE